MCGCNILKTRKAGWSNNLKFALLALILLPLLLLAGAQSPVLAFEGIRADEVDRYKRATLERESEEFVHSFKNNYPRTTNTLIILHLAHRLAEGRPIRLKFKF